eukprot:4770425-Lingulodinium_polyedra.AAC.1
MESQSAPDYDGPASSDGMTEADDVMSTQDGEEDSREAHGWELSFCVSRVARGPQSCVRAVPPRRRS